MIVSNSHSRFYKLTPSLVFCVTTLNCLFLSVVDVQACECQKSSQGYLEIHFISRDSSSSFHRLHCLFDHCTTTMEERLVRPEQLYTNIIMVICILIRFFLMISLIFFSIIKKMEYVKVPLCTACCLWLQNH